MFTDNQKTRSTQEEIHKIHKINNDLRELNMQLLEIQQQVTDLNRNISYVETGFKEATYQFIAVAVAAFMALVIYILV